MNKNNQKLVSIVIITHNRVELLKNAIESCVNQDYENIEIIVVDDFSTDNTSALVELFSEKYSNIKYIKLTSPSGANAARNRGILAANGYYITGLDDDDTFLPTRVSGLVNGYDEDLAYVFSQVFLIYPNKTVRNKFLYLKDILTLDDMLYTNFTGNQILTTKQLYLDAGLYDEQLVSAQDYDMWLKLLLLKPKARLVKEYTMNVDRNDAIKRISNSKRRIKGYFQIYKRYKQYMNIHHKKFQIFKLLVEKNKIITPKVFFRHLSYKYIIRYIYLIIKIKMSK